MGTVFNTKQGGTGADNASDARTNLGVAYGTSAGTVLEGSKDAEYRIVADLYKYRIVTSVSSGNLTVALKNYLGDDPSVAVPVKVQIGDTVRTVTSALSLIVGAGGNNLNLGSSELATKECDLFTYLFWYSTKSGGSSVGMAIARFPTSNIWTDFINSPTNEKGVLWISDGVNFPANTDPFTNIGRFNATLSASPYNWSIPATSVVLNEKSGQTKNLNWVPTIDNKGTANIDTIIASYQIVGEKCFVKGKINIITKGTASGDFICRLPFQTMNSLYIPVNGGLIASGVNPATGKKAEAIFDSSNELRFMNGYNTSWIGWAGVADNDFIYFNGFYNI